MLVIVMAALIAAPPSPTPTGDGPPETQQLTVTAKAPIKTDAPVEIDSADDWTYKPPDAQILSVWPEAAYRARIDGHVVLNCLVDTHGLAEDCAVVSETPAKLGFGRAALLLRPSFKLKPSLGPNGPVAAMRILNVGFKASDSQIEFSTHGTDIDKSETRVTGTPPEMRSVIMLDHPAWTRAAGFADVAGAYPAKGGGVEGFAVAHCRVERSGELSRCELRKDDPHDRGFGRAALGLTHLFRAQLDGARPPSSAPLWVDIPMRFPPPAETLKRDISSPTWLAGFDEARGLKLFPPEAVAQGLTTGLGIARCEVTPDGALTACAPMPGDPDGLGFSEAAVKLASVMKMNPWTADGAPVDGAVIRVPIRLNLAAKK